MSRFESRFPFVLLSVFALCACAMSTPRDTGDPASSTGGKADALFNALGGSWVAADGSKALTKLVLVADKTFFAEWASCASCPAGGAWSASSAELVLADRYYRYRKEDVTSATGALEGNLVLLEVTEAGVPTTPSVAHRLVRSEVAYCQKVSDCEGQPRAPSAVRGVFACDAGSCLFEPSDSCTPAPGTEQIVQLDASPTLAGRTGHDVVWTGTELLVWGGQGSGGYASGARYDPVLGTWRAMSAEGAPSSRRHSFIFWTGTEMGVLFGEDPPSDLWDGGLYDPTSDSWRPIPAHTAATGRVILHPRDAFWAGTEFVLAGTSVQGVPVSEAFDPATGTWRKLPPLLSGDHTASKFIWRGSDLLVVVQHKTYNSAIRSDVSRVDWSTLAIVKLDDLRGGERPRDQVLAGDLLVGESYVFNLKSLAHTAKAPEPIGWDVPLASGQWDGANVHYCGSHPTLGTACTSYNPATDSWTTPTRISETRFYDNDPSVWGGGTLYKVGGYARYEVEGFAIEEQESSLGYAYTPAVCQ